jgi:hypothetical protein
MVTGGGRFCGRGRIRDAVLCRRFVTWRPVWTLEELQNGSVPRFVDASTSHGDADGMHDFTHTGGAASPMMGRLRAQACD